ncbi:MAG: ribonuclease P protein component [Acidimicrobiia bacterium]|nr:ribonuclease P protein component [Acidimicrobiia bacterium]
MTKGVSASARSGRQYVSLRGRRNFAAARRGNRRAAGSVVVLLSEGSPGPPQVAFVAGKRVGNAVRRNRAKRRLRAAMERIPLRDGTACVVIARSGADEAPFDRLVEWLAKATRPAQAVSNDTVEQEMT